MMRQSFCLSVCGWVCQVCIPTFELTEFHATYAVTTDQPTVALPNFLELVRITLLTSEIWSGSKASTTYFRILK
jgi:hypothetical protein